MARTLSALLLCLAPLCVLAPAATAAAAPPQDAAHAKLVELVIDGSPPEEPALELPFGPLRRNFRSTLSLLRRIAKDPEVSGILLDLRSAPDFVRSGELIEELRRVQDAGKKIFCYAETLSQAELRIATVADHLAVPPGAIVVLEGFTAEAMYLKDLLAKLHARVVVLHVGEYKTAYEELARDGMSDEQRETIGAILDEYWDGLVGDIAANRGLTREQVVASFEDVLVPPDAALEAGLIDAVVYEDEFRAEVRELLGGEVEITKDYGDERRQDFERMMSNPFTMLATLTQILEPPKRKLPPIPRIAVVYATGQITSGKSTIDWDGRTVTMGSDTIVEALEATLADDLIRAVVFRVDSPGGSALASDQIWRSIQRVRAKKPVVASMGRVAGSGGYWVSMGCDRIVARPSTITGSIGVVSALPDLSGSLAALGIDVEVVSRGPHAGELSLLENGPSELLQEKVRGMMERVYGDFLDKVASGRGLARERVAELGRGRVWTGRQALERGLVDELGGLREALLLAADLGGGLDLETTPIVELPEPRGIFDQFEEAFGMAVAPRGRLQILASELGFEEAARSAELLLGDDRALSPDRVQCVLPFVLRIR